MTAPDPRNVPQRSAPAALIEWLRAFWPTASAVDARERLRVVVGSALGIFITAMLSHLSGGPAATLTWLVAPMGASAVLVFAVPASPMAQPWSVIGGNTVSALVGVACVRWIGTTPEWTAAMAVSGAIALMFTLRCLHPPGGASALLVALTGVSDPSFALFPVLANSVLLVAAGIAYNSATRRAYPHRQLPPTASAARGGESGEVDELDADLDAVLSRYNQVLDVSRDDLKALLEDTQLQAYQRKLANIRCGDIMSRELITVSHGTPLQDAWTLFREHRIKALPVVDARGSIVGIVTPADFMRAAELDSSDGFDMRMRQLRGWTIGKAANKPEVVGEIMSRQVRVASADRHLAELIPLFGSSGHHHIPIVGENDRLVGIVTQSDVVSALCRPTQSTA